MEERKLTRVKVTDERVEVDFIAGENDCSVGRQAPPSPALKTALAELKADVCAILEEGESFAESMTVRGINVGYKKAGITATVTVYKTLEEHNSPWNITTPVVKVLDEGAAPDAKGAMTDSMEARIKKVTQAAFAYIDAAASQMSLFG